jgi:ABC-type amino acid transport substrate-binding protein
LPVFESLAKSLGFKIAKKEDQPYNPEFVKEILQAIAELKEGKGIKRTLDEIDKLWK